MLIYDVDKIEDLYKDFEKAKKDFINKEYDDFKSSYFYSCSDNVIVKLRNRIQTIYDNIQKGYDMIDKVWKEYIDDVGNYDKSIASGGNCGIHDGGVNSIVSQICSIDLYETAGVSTSFKSIAASGKGIGKEILNALKRTGASILNTAISLISGVAKFVEAILDCAVLVVGAIAGLIILAGDALYSLFSGDKRNGVEYTKKYFNGLLRLVGNDGMGSLKKKFYESSSVGKWLDENSYGPFKSDGVVYGIGEGIGYVTGVIVLTVATFGAGAPLASVGTQVGSGIVAGAGAMGKAAQSGYNSTVDKVVAEAAANGIELDRNNVELSGGQMAKIIGNSVVQGGIEGVTFAATYGNGLKANASFDKIAKNVVGPKKLGINKEQWAKAGIQFAKEYAKAGSDEVFDIKDHTAGEVLKDATISATVSIVYDKLNLGERLLRVTSDKVSGVSSSVKAATVQKSQESMSTSATLISGGLNETDDTLTKEAVKAMKEESKKSYSNMIKDARTSFKNASPTANEILYNGGKKIVGTPAKTGMKKVINGAIDLGKEIISEAA